MRKGLITVCFIAVLINCKVSQCSLPIWRSIYREPPLLVVHSCIPRRKSVQLQLGVLMKAWTPPVV